MPYLLINTNVNKDKIPANFLKETAKLLAKTVGKPESYCVVQVIPDQFMSWGGGQTSCGIAHLHCIGKIGVTENKNTSAVLSNHIEEALGIPSDKLYIFFHDADKANVGYSATTFHELL